MAADIAAGLSFVRGLMEFVQNTFTSLQNLRRSRTAEIAQKKQTAVEAVIAIQDAVDATQPFVERQNFERSPELRKLWQDVLRKCVAADLGGDLPEWIFNKVEFWSRPEDWINNPETLELVPRLHELREECKQLLRRLQ